MDHTEASEIRPGLFVHVASQSARGPWWIPQKQHCTRNHRICNLMKISKPPEFVQLDAAAGRYIPLTRTSDATKRSPSALDTSQGETPARQVPTTTWFVPAGVPICRNSANGN